MYCELYVAECGSSKQRQWLWGFCATGELYIQINIVLGLRD